MALAGIKYDWNEIKDVFVNETPRPTYTDLAERFSMPIATLSRVAADESWPDLRVTHQLAKIQQSDALQVITEAAKNASSIANLAFETLVALLTSILSALAELDKDKDIKPRGRMDILNTASFALQNASNAAKGFGITNLPDALKRAAGAVPNGLDGRGQWSPGLVQQINLTVQTMKEKTEKPAGGSSSESAPITVENALDSQKPTTK